MTFATKVFLVCCAILLAPFAVALLLNVVVFIWDVAGEMLHGIFN